MDAKRIREVEEFLLAVIMLEFSLIILFVVVIHITNTMNYSVEETRYYFQNCNNLTLFPDGCQVLS